MTGNSLLPVLLCSILFLSVGQSPGQETTEAEPPVAAETTEATTPDTATEEVATDAEPPTSDSTSTVDDTVPASDSPTADATDTADVDEPADTVDKVSKQARELADDTVEKVGELAAQVDESEQAKEVSAGILKPIYALAETLSFPAFHWLAFMFMVTGVVSFALQLVLGKLIVLAKMGFSLTEILADALGLVISAVGLVLTTQAAAENSSFTQSPAAVISATVVGAVLGLCFYVWGQSQELQALKGRKVQRYETDQS